MNTEFIFGFNPPRDLSLQRIQVHLSNGRVRVMKTITQPIHKNYFTNISMQRFNEPYGIEDLKDVNME